MEHSSSSDLPAGVIPLESTDGLPEIELYPHQDDELFGCDDYFLVFISGGRGSGKTYVNPLHILRRGQICTDQPYVLVANTWDQLINAILPPIQEVFAEIGWEENRDYIIGKRVPPKWRRDWRRKGIRTPIIRLRNVKMLVLRNGVHVYLLTTANRAWTRIKGHEVQAIFAEEMTEPDVPLTDFITYAVGSVRCGKGKENECRARGHMHQVFIKFNVPLHNPSHEVYKLKDKYLAQEKRLPEGKRFFRLIESSTRDNLSLPDDFHDRMRLSLDPDTYEEQTSGKLIRRSHATTYHQFSEANIIGPQPDGRYIPTYDPARPLHLWFDFNATPASGGFGHDLRPNEIPERAVAGVPYFGVVGELFSNEDPMSTEQVATALLEDPARGTKCGEIGCGHPLDRHTELREGFLCKVCSFATRDASGRRRFCSGAAVIEAGAGVSKFLHVPSNWRGLMKHRGHIYVYADASGRSASAQAVNPKGGNIGILRDVFGSNIAEVRLHFRIKSANPSEITRIAAVNRGLRAANHAHAIYFLDYCAAHIDDCREVVPGPDGKQRKEQKPKNPRQGDEYWKRTHAMDGFGYMWDFRHPFRIPKAGAPDVGGVDIDYPDDLGAWPEP